MAPNPKDVLQTLQQDGKRRWIRPRVAPGRFLTGRRIVGYGLIVLFAVLPFLRVGGRPALLLDVRAAELSLFGMVFRPSDGFLLMLLGLTVVATVLLVTALFGRVWCGWGCPQTVYMEFLFRPVERLFEGSVGQQQAMDKKGGFIWKRAAVLGIFGVLSFFVANVFLAYFVGTDQLLKWVTSSPAEHPGGFAVVAGVTVLMMADFGYFREQVCIMACPYGRLQSTLLDTNSMIVAYDGGRGEPRGATKKKKLPVLADAADQKGDCIDCGACVAVCPTGIDIRNGLQLECIGCAQCIDACDAVMTKVEKPVGLIRYTSQNQLAGKASKVLRVRTIVYPVLLLIAVGFLILKADTRSGSEVWIVRSQGVSWTKVDAQTTSSIVLLKIENKGDAERVYAVELQGVPDAKLRTAGQTWKIKSKQSMQLPVIVDVPTATFVRGERPATLVVKADEKIIETLSVRLLGPEVTP